MSWLTASYHSSTALLQEQASGNFVRKVEIVKKRSLMGFMGHDWVAFLKITLADSKSLPKVRDESCSLL